MAAAATRASERYQRVDVSFHDALAEAIKGGSPQIKQVSFNAQVDSAAVMRLDGNTVDLDAESARLAANALENQALAHISSGRSGAMKAAIGIG